MKKVKGNLSLIIASFVCMIILFGCSSISSRAADPVQKATNLQFTNKGVAYTPVSPGYYALVFTRENAEGVEIIEYSVKNLEFSSETVGKSYSAWGGSIDESYNYQGKKTFYVIASSTKISSKYNKIEDYKKDSNCVIESRSVTVNTRMDQPKGLKQEETTYNNEKVFKITWEHVGNFNYVVNSSKGPGVIHYGSNCIYVSTSLAGEVVEVRTKTSDFGKYANSEPSTIKLGTGEKTEPENPDDKGKSDEGTKPEESGKDTSAKDNTPAKDDNKTEPPKVEEAATLPATVIDGAITYEINAEGKATVKKIGDVKKVSINEVIYSGVTYPVTTIAANAAKGNKQLTSVTIGSNVIKIEKKAFYNCKKLKKVTVKANKALKIEKNAFKKIHKKAVIVVKGAKGKAKKKLMVCFK